MRTLTSLTVVAVAVPLAALAAQTRTPVAPAAPAAPIGAYSVVPELPGMGRPVDIAAVAARRQALMKRIGRGAVLIPAGHETQDAFLLMTARGPDSIETVLFLAPRVPSQERWTGLRLGPDSVAARLSGISTVLPLDSLDNRVRAARQPLYTPQGRGRAPRAPDVAPNSLNVTAIVDSMRVVKDADEVSRLRRAVDIS